MPAPGAVASTVPEELAQVVAAFAAMTDPRFARGNVHPLPGGLDLSRGHWGIETRLFHGKDDSFGEDRHVLPSHHSAILAALDGLWKGLSLTNTPIDFSPQRPMMSAPQTAMHPALVRILIACAAMTDLALPA